MGSGTYTQGSPSVVISGNRTRTRATHNQISNGKQGSGEVVNDANDQQHLRPHRIANLLSFPLPVRWTTCTPLRAVQYDSHHRAVHIESAQGTAGDGRVHWGRDLTFEVPHARADSRPSSVVAEAARACGT